MSIGLIASLLTLMAKGPQALVILLSVLLLLFAVTYAVEFSVTDLSEFTEVEAQHAASRSRRAIWFAVVLLLVGAILYVFDI